MVLKKNNTDLVQALFRQESRPLSAKTEMVMCVIHVLCDFYENSFLKEYSQFTLTKSSELWYSTTKLSDK